MKRQAVQDERIVLQSRKILSEALSLLMLALLVSTLVQQFLFKAPFKQYAVEWLCFLGASLYIVIRKIALGMDIFGGAEVAKSIAPLNSVVTGTAITAVNGILNYSRYAESYSGQIGSFIIELLIMFVCATACSFIMLLFLSNMSNRKQMQIQKKLDEED